MAKITTMAKAVKRDPKVGTGKKPKGSDRRLYTDISKPYARKIQILTVGEQRAKVMGKSEVASIFKRGKESIRRNRNA